MAILADETTRILVQGITGREATSMVRASLDYGARVVAGVTPGKGGWEVYGVPVYDTVRQAVSEHPADAAVIAVPPAFARGAVLEALENRIRLVVVLTERIPRRDVVELVEMAERSGAVIIGPNSLGIISPGKTKVGMVGGPAADVHRAYRPGRVGIISRSGGMTTEIANLLTLNGIGQSTCVSMGGDPIVGSNFLDLVRLFAADPETDAVVIFCEPGGTNEEELARYYRENQPELPVVAFIAGRFADCMPGVRFGHAATVVEGERGRTSTKAALFEEAGIAVADELVDIVSSLERDMRPQRF